MNLIEMVETQKEKEEPAVCLARERRLLLPLFLPFCFALFLVVIFNCLFDFAACFWVFVKWTILNDDKWVWQDFGLFVKILV